MRSASGAIPIPVSRTVMWMWSPSARTWSETRPSAGVNLIALLTTLASTCRMRPPSTTARNGSVPPSATRVMRRACAIGSNESIVSWRSLSTSTDSGRIASSPASMETTSRRSLISRFMRSTSRWLVSLCLRTRSPAGPSGARSKASVAFKERPASKDRRSWLTFARKASRTARALSALARSPRRSLSVALRSTARNAAR